MIILTISTLLIIQSLTNVSAICSTDSGGASLCAGADFNAVFDKTNSQNTDFSDYFTIHKFRIPSLANHADQLEHMFDHTNDGRIYWKIDKAVNEITLILESPIGHPYLIKHETLQKYSSAR